MSRKAMMRLLYIILALMVVPTAMTVTSPVAQQRSGSPVIAVQQQSPILASAQQHSQNVTLDHPLLRSDLSSSSSAAPNANDDEDDEGNPPEDVDDTAGDSDAEDTEHSPPDFDSVLNTLLSRYGDQTDAILIAHVKDVMNEAAGPSTHAQLKQIRLAIVRARAQLAVNGQGCEVLPLGLSMVSLLVFWSVCRCLYLLLGQEISST